MSRNNYSSSGIGLVGLIGFAFVVLKLTYTIDWSWGLVTLPFWGGFVLIVILKQRVIILKQSVIISMLEKDTKPKPPINTKSKITFQERLEAMHKAQSKQ